MSVGPPGHLKDQPRGTREALSSVLLKLLHCFWEGEILKGLKSLVALVLLLRNPVVTSRFYPSDV